MGSSLRRIGALSIFLLANTTAWGGVFHRPALGREDLPSEDTLERSQAGRLELGQFVPTKMGAAAARPDGSGTGSQYYRLSMLDAFRGNKMGFLADAAAVSDRDRARTAFPTQLSYLVGMGSRSGPWRIQFDRVENLLLDRSGGSSRYWDVRAGAMFEAELSGLRPVGGSRGTFLGAPKESGPTLRGEIGAGYFLHNKSFPARATQTGTAALRYEGRLLLSAGSGLRLKADADFLTDKARRLAASNLDLTLGAGWSFGEGEFWVERCSSDVLDGPGYEHYFLLKFVYPYSVKGEGG